MNPTTEGRLPDWEAFYRDYRKPGYVAGFEITTKLGGGMFGLVFRARRMSIGKDYAIKFLQVDDENVRKAVLGELEQVKYFAQIDHPNLVSIEDRGEVDGIPYLVMAFAGTETLRDKMPSGREPTAAEKDELLRCFLQCCRGLAALHERSLVHFDIKPANVFLKGGVARLGDYGLSKLVTHSRGSLSMGRGTPYYMAPEMLQRRGDHRSDVYSLGVMLYELLCGKVPFTGDSEWEVLKKHETAAAELPGHLTGRERAVLQRCLQKDPAARYQSVHDLIAAFGAPASVGAAAWTDVRPAPRATSATSIDAPPPLPGQTAQAAGGEEDAVAGLGRAGREAMRHASTLAQKAAQGAGKLAQQAAAEAQRAVHDAVKRSHRDVKRRFAAMWRLKNQHRGEASREQALEVAETIAEPLPRRRRRGWILVPVAMVAGLMFLSTMFRVRSLSSTPATVSSIASDGVVVSSDRAPMFRGFKVPPGFEGQVSLSEPVWVDLAQRDVTVAREELLRQIERLRRVAPLDAGVRATVVELPKFTPQAEDARNKATIARRVEQFLDRADYDDDLAAQLVAAAPQSLVVVAEQLARIRWQRPEDLQQALRLQKLLEDATGCHDLTVQGDETTPLPELAAGNRNLGALWLWFVNEFAHTKRTWETFRQLMAR